MISDVSPYLPVAHRGFGAALLLAYAALVSLYFASPHRIRGYGRHASPYVLFFLKAVSGLLVAIVIGYWRRRAYADESIAMLLGSCLLAGLIVTLAGSRAPRLMMGSGAAAVGFALFLMVIECIYSHG